MIPTPHGPALVLFNHDFDRAAFGRLGADWPHCSTGFDLFRFPDNAQLAWFDIERYTARLARRARHEGVAAVLSAQEQFGALAAARLAERLGLPGTPVEAVLACQHKLYARALLQDAAPEANLAFEPLQAAYGEDIPDGLRYPLFIKPVKAAFSVLARRVRDRAELRRHTRFGPWELWVIRHLVEPFDRVCRERLPEAGSAHRMMIEAPVQAPQYNLDGYVYQGQVRALGVVDAVMYPGTQAFMRFDYPSRLPPAVAARALDVAARFLRRAGFSHGSFNMEFFHDPASDRLSVIEFNPRMASQFSDFYRQVDGLSLHEVALALAHGIDPDSLTRRSATAGAASSLVYRRFPGQPAVRWPAAEQLQALAREVPQAELFTYRKDARAIARDFKWLGSYRQAVLNLVAEDTEQLRARALAISERLGWDAPYAQAWHPPLEAPAPLSLDDEDLSAMPPLA